ncbi:helix-turn-helix transcriptional regulator [bacterium]|nr:helix-turn-helix transcriptional regulator [bacterium]
MNIRSNIFAEVIEEACRQRGWNLSQLARHVGKSATTLARWKESTSGSCDVYALAEIFRLAGLSMDEGFRLRDHALTHAVSENAQLRGELDDLRGQLDRHESVLNGLHSVFALLGEGSVRLTAASGRKESQVQAEQESCLSDVLSSLDRTIDQIDRLPGEDSARLDEDEDFGWQRRA